MRGPCDGRGREAGPGADGLGIAASQGDATPGGVRAGTRRAGAAHGALP